jgi:hypothetical protein
MRDSIATSNCNASRFHFTACVLENLPMLCSFQGGLALIRRPNLLASTVVYFVHKVSFDCLRALALAAPSVLTTKESNGLTSLLISIKQSHRNVLTADMLVMSNPLCSHMLDSRNNTVLHMACANGSSLDVLRHLAIIYPEALALRNHSGQTPLNIAQAQTSMCPSEIADYLWERAQINEGYIGA